MADQDLAVPEENCEYRVVLGRSLLADGEETDDGGAQEGDSGDAAYALFQYKFTPASVDATIPGLVSMDDSTGATVLRGTTTKASTDGGISFKGKIAEQKDTECLLIFDGTSFRLERCDYVLSQLRHVRTAPSQRPPPSAYPAPMSKKILSTGFARRVGKIVKPATKGTKKARAKNAAADKQKRVLSEIARETSNDPSTIQSTARTPAATTHNDGDRDAVSPPSSKRQRQED